MAVMVGMAACCAGGWLVDAGGAAASNDEVANSSRGVGDDIVTTGADDWQITPGQPHFARPESCRIMASRTAGY